MPPGRSAHPLARPQAQEKRLRHKIPAVVAFAHTNRLNRVVMDGSPAHRHRHRRQGLLDVRQALDDLGIGERKPPRSASASTRWA